MILRYLFLSLFVASFLSPCFAPPKLNHDDDDGSDSEKCILPSAPRLYPVDDIPDPDEFFLSPPPNECPQPPRIPSVKNEEEGTFQPYLLNDDGSPRLWKRIKKPTTKRTAPPVFVVAEMDEESVFYWKPREPDEDDQNFIALDREWLQKGIVMDYTDNDECIFDCNGDAGPGLATLQRRLGDKLNSRKNQRLYKDAHGKQYSITNPDPLYLGKFTWTIGELPSLELDDKGQPTGRILIYSYKNKEFIPLRPLNLQKQPTKGILMKRTLPVQTDDLDPVQVKHHRALKRLLGDKDDLVTLIQQSCPHCVDEATFRKLPSEVQSPSNQYSCWTVASFLVLLEEDERTEAVIHVLRTLNPFGDHEHFYFRELICLDPSMRLEAFNLDPAHDEASCPPDVDTIQFRRQRTIRTFFNEALERCCEIWPHS